MDSSVVVAIITGVVTIVTVLLTNLASNKKVLNQLKTSQEVLDTKYTEKLKQLEKDISVIPTINSDVQSLKTEVAVHDERIKAISKMVGVKQ